MEGVHKNLRLRDRNSGENGGFDQGRQQSLDRSDRSMDLLYKLLDRFDVDIYASICTFRSCDRNLEDRALTPRLKAAPSG